MKEGGVTHKEGGVTPPFQEELGLEIHVLEEHKEGGVTPPFSTSQEEPGLEIHVLEELNAEFVRALCGEFLATTLFLYITVSTILFRNGEADTVTDAAWAFGASILVLVYSFVGISGANINPAVSFGLMIGKKISAFRCVGYIIAQCTGACLGAAIAKSLRPGSEARPWNFVVPDEKYDTDPWQALVAEFMGTFCLVWVVMAACDNNKHDKVPHLGPLAPIAIGMTVFVLHLGMIGIDNCSINPARSFGTSLVFGEWADHWVFWVGPMTGGLFAGAVYDLFSKDLHAGGP